MSTDKHPKTANPMISPRTAGTFRGTPAAKNAAYRGPHPTKTSYAHRRT